MNPLIRYLLIAFACICFALGVVGVFIPVLPTTPLVLLSAFICARCSPRCHERIMASKVYQNYVKPFKEAGGMTISAKIRMLAISYGVLLVSAIVVQRPLVWGILASVAAFLLYLTLVRIPTIRNTEGSGCALNALGDLDES